MNLPSGGSLTYTLTGTISPAATGSLSNTVSVAPPAGWTEPNTADNSATDTDTLTPQANLAITKTDGQATTTPGAGIVYTIVASIRPLAVTGATVADTLPAGDHRRGLDVFRLGRGHVRGERIGQHQPAREPRPSVRP